MEQDTTTIDSLVSDFSACTVNLFSNTTYGGTLLQDTPQ